MIFHMDLDNKARGDRPGDCGDNETVLVNLVVRLAISSSTYGLTESAEFGDIYQTCKSD